MVSKNLEQYKIGHFGFSAVHPTNLGASEYTLVGIVCDHSGSTSGFQNDMENVLKEVVKACQMSPRADNLLLRVTRFSDNNEEVHGFKLLESVQLDDYTGKLAPASNTALYDATLDAIEATVNYGEELTKQDFTTNAVVFIITDGVDNISKYTPTQIRDALKNVVQKESLESLNTVLIGVNVSQSMASNALNDFTTNAGITQYVSLADANKKTLAKLAAFISKSISSQSQSLGSGQASQPVTF